MSRTAKAKALSDAFCELSRVAESNGHGRHIDEAFEAFAREEREHRAFGKRFPDGRAGYRWSVEDTARAFVVREVWGAPPKCPGWDSLLGLRRSFVLCYAVHRAIRSPEFRAWRKRHAELAASFDYSADVPAGVARDDARGV